jgi:urease accessory protein
MAVALANVGRHGQLKLTFASRQGETVLRDAYCEIPFKITRLLDARFSGIAHLILMQCAPGLFGGDNVECTIHVEAGARILITSQSATKVHPSGGKAAIQNTRIRVEGGGELRIYYDPVIPFSGACMRQTTSIDVEAGARFYFWESLMAGRVGRGELWRFDEFSSETCLRLNGKPLYLDRFSIMPASHPPAEKWTMADGRYLATGLCFEENVSGVADRLHRLLPEAGVDTPASGLAAIRVVAAHGPDFHHYRNVFTSLPDLPDSERN